MMKKNVKKGMKVRVVADTFKHDPHGLPIGTIGIVDHIVPSAKFQDLPPMIKLLYTLKGEKPFDFPERVHIKLSDDQVGFANLVEEDFEVIGESGSKVRMLYDDFAGGYKQGDTFTTFEQDGQLVFKDRDGDIRFLEAQPYEFV